MGKVLRFQTGDGEAAPWRGDPTSMITRCIDETNSETMGCGYLTMSKTAQRERKWPSSTTMISSKSMVDCTAVLVTDR